MITPNLGFANISFVLLLHQYEREKPKMAIINIVNIMLYPELLLKIQGKINRGIWNNIKVTIFLDNLLAI